MTRKELLGALRDIAQLLTAEIDRPGDNEDRFLALKRAEKLALDALGRAGTA